MEVRRSVLLIGTTLSSPWDGATVVRIIPPHLHFPIAISGSPEATVNVEQFNQFKSPGPWHGYKPTPLSSEELCAYAQPLLVEQLKPFSQLIHAMMGIPTH